MLFMMNVCVYFEGAHHYKLLILSVLVIVLIYDACIHVCVVIFTLWIYLLWPCTNS